MNGLVGHVYKIIINNRSRSCLACPEVIERPVLSYVEGLLLCIKTKKLKTMSKMSQENAFKDSVPEISDTYNFECILKFYSRITAT